MYTIMRIIGAFFMLMSLMPLAFGVGMVVNRDGFGLTDPFFAVIPFIMAIIFFAVGAVVFFSAHRKVALRKHLEREGVRVIAEVTDLYQNRRTHVNGRHPWVIVAQIMDERGVVTEFTDTIGLRRPEVAVGLPVVVAVSRSDRSKYAILPNESIADARQQASMNPQHGAWSPERNAAGPEQYGDTGNQRQTGNAWDNTDRRNGPFYSN